MILMHPSDKKRYVAQIVANGRIELNPKVENARALLLELQPALVAALDNQADADATIDEVVNFFRSKGALVGREAEVFTKLEATQKDRRDKKGGRK